MANEDSYVEEAIVTLENKYSDRGLKFTSPFEGYVPVQAYGKIDGLRFYFRLREGNASLIVGTYDTAMEEQKYQEKIDRIRNKLAKTSGISVDFWESTIETIEKPTGLEKDYYPILLWFESRFVTDETMKTYFDIFSKLVDTLQTAESSENTLQKVLKSRYGK